MRLASGADYEIIDDIVYRSTMMDSHSAITGDHDVFDIVDAQTGERVSGERHRQIIDHMIGQNMAVTRPGAHVLDPANMESQQAVREVWPSTSPVANR